MALLIPEALKQMDASGAGANLRSMGILLSVVTTDALFARIPFIETSDIGIMVPREGAEPTAGDFIGDDHSSTIAEATGTDDVVSVPLRRHVGDMDVDALVDDFSDGAQRSRHLLKKVKATARKVQDKLINGGHTTGYTLGAGAAASFNAIDAITEYSAWLDSLRRGPGSLKYTHASQTWQFRAPGDVDFGEGVVASDDGTYTLASHNPSYYIKVTLDVSDAVANAETSIYFTSTTKEFDGLKKIIVPSQVIDPTGANGDFFSLSMLDKMITNLKVKSNPAFIMSSTYIELYYAILRSLGGAAPPMMMIPGYGQEVPSYRGIPILADDFILTNETVGSGTTGSLYLASLDADEGLALAAANKGPRFDPQADPARGPVLGWRVEYLGAIEGADRRRTRLAWYGAAVLKSKLAAVRRRGVLAATS